MGKDRKPLSVGIVTRDVQNYRAAFQHMCEHRYSFMCTNLMKSDLTMAESLLNKSKLTDEVIVEEPFSVVDLAIPPDDLPYGVVAKISNVNGLLCSEDRRIYKKAAKKISDEIDFCNYLKIRALLLEADLEQNVFNLAEIVFRKLISSSCIFWIKVPMIFEADPDFEQNFDCFNRPFCSGWCPWSRFHAACNLDKQVGVALEMTKVLPSEIEIQRWLGEPIHCIVIPTSLFTLNEKGFPVLAKDHKKLLKRFFPLSIRVLIEPREPLKAGQKHYRDFISFLYKKWIDEQNGSNWNDNQADVLYSPKQPLIANLKASAYTHLEKDTVKYSLYEKAIEAAILSKPPRNNEELVVMVLGAGRGALVKTTIVASRSANRSIRVYAVEKNPSVISTLVKKQQYLWKAMGYEVEIIHGDMRSWNPKEKADIIVSELLDSFGDNGLSPECLDKVQVYLKDDGIIIPKKCTSYLGPIMSPKLYANTRLTAEAQNAAKNQHDGHLEIPYNVKMRNKFDIDRPQEICVFHHPNLSFDANIDVDVCRELYFKSSIRCNLHGFAGYFEAELFEGITLSTLPGRNTEGLSSWRSVYFPIKTSIHLEKGDVVKLRFKRCSSMHAVWYEWSTSCSASQLPIHNFQGQHFKMIL